MEKTGRFLVDGSLEFLLGRRIAGKVSYSSGGNVVLSE